MFSYIEVWFTDQNDEDLQEEDKINIILVINQSVKYKNELAFSSTKRPDIICKRLPVFVFY